MQITKHTVATFEFTVRDEEGRVLDSSEEFGPYSYVHGVGHLIPGLEAELEGKSPGDTFSIKIPPELAYGPRDESLVHVMPRDRFQGIEDLCVGMKLEGHYPDGVRVLTVTEITDETITVDGNHPLAGKNLNMELELVELVAA